jgi:hypothetical protein
VAHTLASPSLCRAHVSGGGGFLPQILPPRSLLRLDTTHQRDSGPPHDKELWPSRLKLLPAPCCPGPPIWSTPLLPRCCCCASQCSGRELHDKPYVTHLGAVQLSLACVNRHAVRPGARKPPPCGRLSRHLTNSLLG